LKIIGRLYIARIAVSSAKVAVETFVSTGKSAVYNKWSKDADGHLDLISVIIPLFDEKISFVKFTFEYNVKLF